MNQVLLFLILVFGLTWGAGFYVASLPAPRGLTEFLAWFLPQVWAPTVIALMVIGLTEGAGSIRRELRERLSYKNRYVGWLALASIVPATATCIAVFAGRLAGHGAPFIPSSAVPLSIGLQVITGAVGEELGWRGFLLPRLGNRLGAIRAAWTMAILWSVWHIPAWFNPSLPHRTMPMASTLCFTACFGVFLAFVFNRAGGSVIATMLAHLSLNVVMALGGVQLSSLAFWNTLAGIFGLIAIFASVAMGKSPSHVNAPVAVSPNPHRS